jgi:hypothetical protein
MADMCDSIPNTPSKIYSCNIGAFARRYRVDNSRATLTEVRNLSGKPFLGTIFWLVLQTGLLKLNRMVVDGPRPFLDDQCNIDDLRNPVRDHLLSIQATAMTCGFHSPRYSVKNSIGVHGGSIRMLHDTPRMFLQILASSCGPALQGYQILVSAAANSSNVFVSSNGRPNYNLLPGMRIQRLVGVPLATLVSSHEGMLADLSEGLLRFDSFDAVGTVMDYLATRFFEDKINRGIYIAEP